MRYILENVDTTDSYILTSKPLLFQIYGSDNLKIIDFGLIGTGIPEKVFEDVLKNNDVYYLVDKADLTNSNRERFEVQHRQLESRKLLLVHKGSNYWLYRIERS